MARHHFLVTLLMAASVTASWAGVKGKEYKFKGEPNGAQPVSGLVADGAGNFYAATNGGLENCFNDEVGCGTVFRLRTDNDGHGSASSIYEFKGGTDGQYPTGTLIFDASGNLYGTTTQGGAAGSGTVFELSPNEDGSWTKAILYSFQGAANGYAPETGLIFDANGNLYGTTASGGICSGVYCGGTVFKLSPGEGGHWTETTIYEFTPPQNSYNEPSGLVLDAAGNLYGTTIYGGPRGRGSVFRLTPAQNGNWTETDLYIFTDGLDGGFPQSGVTFDAGGNLYGEASQGGSLACPEEGCGTIFKLTPNPDGSWKFAKAYTFDGLNGSKGWYPIGGLTLDVSGNLYGTTQTGGNLNCSLNAGYGCGTIFELTPGMGQAGFKVLARFDGTDGAFPSAGVILDSAGNIYGTTIAGGLPNCSGGYNTCGVAFMLMPSP